MLLCILSSKLHGDTYLRGLMREEVVRSNVCPKTVLAMIVPLSTLSWAGSPGDKFAHHVPLVQEPPLTSTEGSLTVVSCPSTPVGSPPGITTTGPKRPFSSRRNTKQQALPISPSASILLLGVFPGVPGPSGRENATLLIFKRMGQVKSLQFPFSVGFLQGGGPERSSKTQRPNQSLERGRGIPLSSLACPQGQGPQPLCFMLRVLLTGLS